jgi:branched-chain amino acid transport system substrate-binding protein
MENAKGGVNGWKIEYMSPDAGGDPARALQEVRTQISNDQVFAIVWGPGSPENQQVVPYVSKTDVPYVPPGESGDAYVGKSYENVFPSIPPYSAQAIFLGQYAIDELGAKKIALAYEDDAVGKPVHDRFKAAIEAHGGEVVAEVPFAAADTDLTAVGQKLAAAKPDAVVQWGVGQPLVKAKQAAMADGLDVPWLSTYFNADPGVVSLNEKVTDGIYFNYYLEPFFSDDESVQAFKDAMAEHEPDGNAGGLALNGWAGASIFVEALRAITEGGKAPTREALIEELNGWGEREVGVLPGVNYTAEEHRGGSQSYVLQYKDGEFKVIDGPRPLPEVK